MNSYDMIRNRLSKVDLNEIGSVGARTVITQRKADPNDPLSKLGSADKRTITPVRLQTLRQRDKSSRQSGAQGGGATAPIVRRRLGIAASTEMNWKHKLLEELLASEQRGNTP